MILEQAIAIAKMDANKVHDIVKAMSADERDELDQTITNWLIDEIKINNLNKTIEEGIALKCMIYFVYGEVLG